MNRTDLYKLIDTIPESKLPIVHAYLKGFRDGSSTLKVLETAPDDDEPFTEAERIAVEKGRDQAARGEVFTLESVARELSL